MKKRIEKVRGRIAENPVLRESAKAMKPNRSFWGVAGVILLFIAPEIAAFIWGGEITAYAHARVLTEADPMLNMIFKMVEMIFEDGGSWLNLSIGLGLLYWIYHDWRVEKSGES